jgi:hypothetical protein
MLAMFGKIGDRLLAAIVPRTTAAAVYRECACIRQHYYERYCNTLGQCGAWTDLGECTTPQDWHAC